MPGAADLFDPGVNIKLGAAHLRDLVNRFDKQTIVALAGYNAGENAADRWLPPAPIDADIWIENIPYNETRDYVQRVLVAQRGVRLARYRPRRERRVVARPGHPTRRGRRRPSPRAE